MKCKKCEQETPFEKVERNAIRSHWKCPKCYEWQNLGKQCDCSPSALNDGLCALQKLSDKWREDATDATAPPQDATDYPRHDIAETLLNCADELDRLIEEMNT